MTQHEPILSCETLSKAYGGVQAVRGVSFVLHPGEILGLVGPNGAGKTTLVDIISGTQEADSGTITIEGKRIQGSPSRRSRVGGLTRTFQHPQLALEMSIRENLRIGASAEALTTANRMIMAAARGLFFPGNPVDDESAVEIAHALGIDDLDRLCADLTLGERRLIEVGRALLRRPSVVLLDEPFAGSDHRGVENMSRMLHEIISRGCGVLLVDHSVDVVASLVDRIILLDRGSIVFDGDPVECLASSEMQSVYFGSEGSPNE